MNYYICSRCGFVEKDNLLSDGTCDMCGEKILIINHNYAKHIKELEKSRDYRGDRCKDYEELYELSRKICENKTNEVNRYEELLSKIMYYLNKGLDIEYLKHFVEKQVEVIIVEGLCDINLLDRENKEGREK